MQTHHWVLMLVVFAVGYAVARYFPGPGQTVGLP